MAKLRLVAMTSRCHALQPDTLLLPQGTELPRSPVLLLAEIGGEAKRKVMRSGLRSDAGTAACAPADVVADFGGEGAAIRYREASLLDVFRYRRGIGLQFLIALLTVANTLIGVVVGFQDDLNKPIGSLAYKFALASFALAALLAAAKFISELRELR